MAGDPNNIKKPMSFSRNIEINSTKNSDNLKNSPMKAICEIIKSFRRAENFKSTIEFSLGRIKDIFSSERINYRTSHAVVFSKLSQSHVFEEGLTQSFYNKTSYKFQEQNSNKTTDTISIYNTIRKISVKGNMAVYKKKYKTVFCFVYFPNKQYDIKISLCREEPIKNPDRNNRLYEKCKNREKMFFFENDMKFTLKKISDVEIENTKKSVYYYGMKTSMLYDEKTDFSSVINAILELVS